MLEVNFLPNIKFVKINTHKSNMSTARKKIQIYTHIIRLPNEDFLLYVIK